MNRPLKVLQIIPSISVVYGGPSQMVRGLSQAIAAQGVEVTILTTNTNGDAGQTPLEVPLDRPVFENGYQIRYFRCSPFRRYKFSIDLLRWLTQHAYEYDLAHIHALFSPVSSAAATIARQQKLPYILRPLGTLDPADLQKKRQLKRLYAACIERANLAGAAAIHFTTEQEAKVSERFGVITRDLVLPLGVTPHPALSSPSALLDRQLPESKTQSTDPIPTILFMSRLDQKKGLDLLLPALAELQQEGMPFRFVLAGSNSQDPNYEQQIRSQIQALGLFDRTTITGFVSGEHKFALLQQADLFVLPSYYENFGIAVAEAMVARVPVVISNQVHIWNEIADSESGWVCTCNVRSLTNQLRAALEDANERQRRGANAQAHALQHYSWSAIGQRMIEAYHQIVQR